MKVLKNKIIIFVLSCITVVTFLSSCKENEKYDFPGDINNKVFFKVSNTLNDDYDVHKFVVEKNPLETKADIHIKIPVSSTLNAETDIKVDIALDTTIVEQFNILNKTNFISVPTEYFEINKSSLTIPKDHTISIDSLDITMSREKASLLKNCKYLIPLKIKMVNGENAEISHNRGITYFQIVFNEDKDNIRDNAIPLGRRLSDSRTAWTASFNPVSEIVSGKIRNIFDGLTSTRYWGMYRENDLFVTIDTKSEYDNITGIYFNEPQSVHTYSYSLDGNSWIELGNVTASSLVAFYKPIKARFFKIKVHADRLPFSLAFNEFNVYTN